jgi:hypothetical protein
MDHRVKPGDDILRMPRRGASVPIQISDSHVDPDTASRSRGAMRPRCEVVRARGLPHSRQTNVPPSSREGARNAGCSCASAAPCAKGKKHTSVVTTNTPETSGVPHAMGYGLLRALPGDRSIVLSPSLRLRMFPCPVWRGSPGQLLPTYGLQDHTTWAVRATSSSALHRQVTTPLENKAKPSCLIRA